MYHDLGDTPQLDTVSPFATTPTIIQTSMSDVKKSMLSGIGMAFGMAIGGYVLFKLIGKRVM